MQIRPQDISIAVTMYRRMDYIEQALESAVGQTVPVKVRLYDDGSQDESRLSRILARFGDRVEYRRNPKTLGLFRNMNACIEDSETPWLSILHDDDLLARDFIERILEVAPEIDRCSLFCGGTTYITPDGREFHHAGPASDVRWRRITAEDYAYKNWFPFPGQLMHAASARSVGGFPEKSIYTGDWELWFRLAMTDGVVQLGARLGYHRAHLGADRGTTAAAKSGRKAACCGMQVKRNLARLRHGGAMVKFDRKQWLAAYAPLYRDLLVYTWTMPRWLLRYNRRLLLLTQPVGRGSQVIHLVSRVFGNLGLRAAGLGRKLVTRSGLRSSQTFG